MDCELKEQSVGHKEERDNRPLLTAESVEELEKMYPPYVRSDRYGRMGRGELPMGEKLLLAVAFVTLVPIRFVAGMTVLVVYYLICRVCTMFKDPNREDEQEDYAHMVGWRREVVVWSGRVCSRAMLFVFGFYRIKESGLMVIFL